VRRAGLFGIRLLISLMPGAMMVIAAVWAISVYDQPALLQAMVWASGFVFLALAVESTRPDVRLLLATGCALPFLALLSAHVAVEYAVLAVALVAAWSAAAIFRFRLLAGLTPEKPAPETGSGACVRRKHTLLKP